ncbi:hypothetical protein M3175_01485 [Robertmurraya korlensis]|uniref:hypothetical protein n=1 Tax=Robertmurraya korlensis TaxID=519977 RepID=UPI00203DA9B7|nr:hypothetical protein [Robertmurraya korlensis]MCM3599387.1 hypothetical protein [Robertmurraya korlensis]
MKVKALVSFAGVISMAFKEVREIEDKDICEDLIRAGYVEPLESEEQDENLNPDDNGSSRESQDADFNESNSPDENTEAPTPEEGEAVPSQEEEKPVVKRNKKVKADEDQ